MVSVRDRPDAACSGAGAGAASAVTGAELGFGAGGRLGAETDGATAEVKVGGVAGRDPRGPRVSRPPRGLATTQARAAPATVAATPSHRVRRRSISRKRWS